MLLSMLGEKPGARALAPRNVFVDLEVPEIIFSTRFDSLYMISLGTAVELHLEVT